MTRHEIVGADQADQLRAGLLDGDRVLESRVRAALQRDGDLACQNELWDRLLESLDASEKDDLRLTNQLRIRRRAVLSGNTAGRSRRRYTLPHMAIATAASVVLTLGIVLWLGGPPSPPKPQASVNQALEIASTNLANAIVSNVVDIDLDLTNNVDFYAWMGAQSNIHNSPTGNGT